MFLELGSKILFYFYIKYWIHTPLAFFFFVNERKNWKEHWWLAIYRLVKNYYFLFAKIYILKMLFLKEFANFIQGKTLSFLITNMVLFMNMRKLWQFFYPGGNLPFSQRNFSISVVTHLIQPAKLIWIHKNRD